MSAYQVQTHTSISEINENQWNQLARHAYTGSIFYRAEWLQAIEESYDCDVQYITVTKDGNLLGALPQVVESFAGTPLKWLVKPPMGYNGPAILTDESEVFELIANASLSSLKTPIVAQLLSVPNTETLRYGTKLERKGYVPILTTCKFTIDLNSPWENIKSGMEKERRRNLRKADSLNYEVKELSQSEAVLDRLAEKYDSTLERVGGNTVPRAFFGNLCEYMSEEVKIFSASVDGENIGKLLCLADEDQSTLHWLVSAIEDEHFEYYPTEILLRHSIEWGLEHGYDEYNFGGTPADFEHGLFKFKSEWGGRVEPVVRWLYVRGFGPVKAHAFRRFGATL